MSSPPQSHPTQSTQIKLLRIAQLDRPESKRGRLGMVISVNVRINACANFYAIFVDFVSKPYSLGQAREVKDPAILNIGVDARCRDL